MATKPADFFIGVADLFAIILPGALLSYLGIAALTQLATHPIVLPRDGTAQGWVAFALSSYLLGHFASLIGAFILDPLYQRTYMVRRKRTGDRLYDLAGDLKTETLGEHDVTTYKWARMRIRLKNASAMQEIDRLEADSKFFRSLTVVLLILPWGIASEFVSHPGTEGSLSLWGVISGVSLWVIFFLLSFWRFSNLRWKAAEAAYLAVIALGKTGSNKTVGAA